MKKKALFIISLFCITFSALSGTIFVNAAATTSFSVVPDATTAISNNMEVSLNTSLMIDENDSTDYGDFVFEVDKLSLGTNSTLEGFTSNVTSSSSIPAPFSLGNITDEGGFYKIIVNFDYSAINGEPYNGNLSIKYKSIAHTTVDYIGTSVFKMMFNGQEFTEIRDVNILKSQGSYVLFDKWHTLPKDPSDNYFRLGADSSRNIFYLPVNYSGVGIDHLNITDTRPANTEYTEALPYPADPTRDLYNNRGVRIYKVTEWRVAVHEPLVVENATREYEQYMSFDSAGNFKLDLPDGLTENDSLIVQYALAVTSDPEVSWKGYNIAEMKYQLASESIERTARYSIPLKPEFLHSDSYSFYKRVSKNILFIDKNGNFIEGQELEYTLRVRTYAGGHISPNTQFVDILDANVEFVSAEIDEAKWQYSVSGNNFEFSNLSEIEENSSHEIKLKVKVLAPDENYVIKNTFSAPNLSVTSNATTTILTKGSSVRVEYVDTSGTKLAADSIIAGLVGDSFVTEPKEFDSWHIKEIIGNTEGTISEDVQVVRYVYERDISSVQVEHVDSDGVKLAQDVIITGFVGDPFTTEAKQFDGWHLKEVIGNTEGTISKDVQVVRYVYERDTSSVRVEYVDTDGAKLAQDVIITGFVGDPFTTEAKQFNGWHLKEVIGNTEGTISKDVQVVKYVYERDTSSVRVEYVDTNGKKLAEDLIITGSVGAPFTTEAKQFDGWHLKETIGNTNGIFTEELQVVVYIYGADESPSTDNTDNTTNTTLPKTGATDNPAGLIIFASGVITLIFAIRKKISL